MRLYFLLFLFEQIQLLLLNAPHLAQFDRRGNTTLHIDLAEKRKEIPYEARVLPHHHRQTVEPAQIRRDMHRKIPETGHEQHTEEHPEDHHLDIFALSEVARDQKINN